jgi:hypothetical protein
MKNMKMIPETIKQKLVLDHVVCDLCGCTTLDAGVWDKPRAPQGEWHENEATVKLQQGCGWPNNDGGEYKHTTFDICPTCFVTKLVPWLESQGAKPDVTASDW